MSLSQQYRRSHVFGLSVRRVRSSVRSFVLTDLVTTIANEQLDLVRFCMSKVKVIAGRRGGEGVDVFFLVEVHLLICAMHPFIPSPFLRLTDSKDAF